MVFGIPARPVFRDAWRLRQETVAMVAPLSERFSPTHRSGNHLRRVTDWGKPSSTRGISPGEDATAQRLSNPGNRSDGQAEGGQSQRRSAMTLLARHHLPWAVSAITHSEHA